MIRCILGRHDWLRVESGLLICRKCYKRGRPDDVHRWLVSLRPGWGDTNGRMNERGELFELVLWAAVVGVPGGLLLFAYLTETAVR